MTRGTTRDRSARDGTARLFSQATALHQAGRLTEAEAAYRRVLRAAPGNAEAWHMTGIAVLQQGRPAEAVDLIAEAARLDSTRPQYHDNLGSAHAMAGQPREAAEAHLRAIRLKPDSEAAFFNLGNALTTLGHKQAVSAFLVALTLNPRYAKAWFNLGNALRAGGNDANAVVAFRRTARIEPTLAVAHTNWGTSLAALGLFAEAAERHAEAIRLDPVNADTWYNRGSALVSAGRPEDAEMTLRRALCLAPARADILNNLGNVSRTGLRTDEGEARHRRALALDPAMDEALYNLANAVQLQGRAAEAITLFDEVLRRDPRHVRATLNRGRLDLARGALARGWDGYERRFLAGEALPDRRFPVRRWSGKPLDGRLLVWREQGVGDEILFASCYDALPAGTIVEADPRLVSLLQRSFPTLDIRPERVGAPLDAGIAAEIPAGSLPGLWRRDLGAFGQRGHWLTADPARVALWRDRLAALPPGLKVGIAWTSGLVSKERESSYTRLADWRPLFDLPGVILVNLQYGDVEAVIRLTEERDGVRLHRWPDLDLKNDFEGTAALMSGLDLVVSVGTAVGELAAALGVATWRLGLEGDWTSLGTSVRPWYPAMTTITAGPGGVAATLPKVARRLRNLRSTPVPPVPTPGDRKRAEDLVDRAIATHQGGRLADAEGFYRQALALAPDHRDAGRLLGVVLFQMGRGEEAIRTLGAALDRVPDDGAAWETLGVMHQMAGRYEAARAAFTRSVVLAPGWLAAATHLGVAVERCGDLDGARAWQARAVRLDPTDPALRVNFGVALERAGGFAAAERQYRIAAAVQPGHAEALNNLGNAARLSNDPKAEAWVRRTIRVAPEHPLANWNLGLIDLTAGRLDSGWAGYERRFTAEALERGRTLAMPVWRGEPLGGRRLLVWNEQGLGDEVLFSSCIDALKGLDGPVIVECDRRLVPLLARTFPWAGIRAAQRNPTDADVHIPMGSLPVLFRRSIGAFPGTVWLSPEPELARHWRERVAALPPGLRVGIGWRSGLVDVYRQGSYTAIEDWAPLLTQPGVVAVNLQYGEVEDELAPLEDRLGVRIHRWTDLNLKDDLEGVAALIAALDLVTVVPTAAGELAGALGVPVWRLGGPDWTWLGTRVRPWFPTMRIWPPSPGLPMSALPGQLARHLARLRPV